MPRIRNRKPEDRLYTRERGGMPRYYADLRDLGGGQRRLVPPGARHATSDRNTALALLLGELKRLEADPGTPVPSAPVDDAPPATFAAFATWYLIRRKQAGTVTDNWLTATEKWLTRAAQFFGPARPLDQLRPTDVRRFMEHLTRQPSGRREDARMSPGTVRHHLNAISNLYRYAQEAQVVPLGCNPVGALVDKPTGKRRGESRFLTHAEVAALVEAARTLPPVRNRRYGLPPEFVHALVATFALSGAREAEVLGLDVHDVSFDRGTITFRPNATRRLKNAGSARVVPLWPQLRDILGPFICPPDRTPRTGLLFANPQTGKMLTDWRKQLDRVAVRAGSAPCEIRSRVFRHSYTAARLQTLDQGAPVSVWTLSRELGHGSTAMVERVYGHLGDIRHRAEVVEFRVERKIEAVAA
jgi:integrase